jgi:aminopeptidase
MTNILQTLHKNLTDIVRDAIGHQEERRALIIFDLDSPLSSLLTEGYKLALPQAITLDFNQTLPADIHAHIDQLSPSDLVVLIQSSSFRLNEFRFRLELFNRSLAVIEHPHLGRMPNDELETYVNALAYDKDYYHGVGHALRTAIGQTQEIIVETGDVSLKYQAPFETAKPNLGDYTGMKNIGGQFPIGEVFTEPSDLKNVNGQVRLFAYGDINFKTFCPSEPILVTIKEGVITDTQNAPDNFQDIVEQLRQDGELWVRELGFGLNRALTRTTRLSDIGSYERMCGVHLSLGAKHTMYAKPGFGKRAGKFHVDVFAEVTRVLFDGRVVFEHGQYVI